MRLSLAFVLCLVVPPGGRVDAKIFEKCELAWLLETKHAMPREEVKSWVCIAEHESTFNTEAINHFKNPDGSKDYGLFQLNDKYWCGSDRGKNVCRMPCSALTDDDLTDDLKCIRKIIKDTERWKGPGTGLSAWVAYEIRCKYQNLDAYIAECYDGSHPSTTTTESQPIDNFIPRLPEATPSSSSTTEMTPPSASSAPGSDPTQNEVDIFVGKPAHGSQDEYAPVGKPGPGSSDATPVGKPGPGSPDATPVGKPGQGTPVGSVDETAAIIPSARVPYPSHHELIVSEEVSRRGSVAIHVSSGRLSQLSGSHLGQVLLPMFI